MKVSKGGSRSRGSSGSPHHTERYHGGKEAGAGEVRTGEPGGFARSVKSTMGQNMSSGPASGSAPKGLKVYREE